MNKEITEDIVEDIVEETIIEDIEVIKLLEIYQKENITAFQLLMALALGAIHGT